MIIVSVLKSTDGFYEVKLDNGYKFDTMTPNDYIVGGKVVVINVAGMVRVIKEVA